MIVFVFPQTQEYHTQGAPNNMTFFGVACKQGAPRHVAFAPTDSRLHSSVCAPLQEPDTSAGWIVQC